MRTPDELEDISVRAKCGYALLQQSMIDVREKQTLEKGVYGKMFTVLLLIMTVDNTYLTLKQRNSAADRLVRERVVVKREISEFYVQPGYWEDYVDFTQS